jgi:Mce-associated membrane protein
VTEAPDEVASVDEVHTDSAENDEVDEVDEVDEDTRVIAPPPTVRAEIGPVSRRVEARPVGKRSPLWVALVLLLVIVGLTAATVFFATRSAKDSSTKARDEAVAAAKTYASYVMSYNYKSIDDDKARTLPHLTGQFRDDYSKSIDEVIKPQAPAQKAVVEGTVDSAGLESVSPNGKQITCLVVGSQKVTNISLTEPRTDPVRLRVTLDRVGKEWKISKLDAL